MAKNLVIVESPAKVKSIKKFLGSNYDVEASNGHVRDFPKSQFGIDVENDYEPKYITIRGRGELLAELRKAAKKADKIYLATDPDREGEAISWHLMQALKLKTRKDAPHHLQRDHQKCRKSFPQACPRSGHESGGCAADQTNAGPDGGIHHQPASVGEGEKRPFRRPCTVGGAPASSVTEKRRSTPFIPEEYWTLEAQFPVPGRKKAADRQILRNTEKSSRSKPRKRWIDPERSLEGQEFCGIRGKNGRTDQKRAASLYHLHAAAGSQQGPEFFHPEDHADRPAAV